MIAAPQQESPSTIDNLVNKENATESEKVVEDPVSGSFYLQAQLRLQLRLERERQELHRRLEQLDEQINLKLDEDHRADRANSAHLTAETPRQNVPNPADASTNLTAPPGEFGKLACIAKL
jgi:hypothetical protein